MQGFEHLAFPGAAVGGALVQALAQVFSLQAGGTYGYAGLFVGRVADDQAVTNLDDALGPGSDFAIVSDQDHHMTLAGQFIEQGHDFGAALAVEGTGGFVGKDDMAAVHQRTGNRHPLLLATGELVGAIAGAAGEPQAIEQRAGAGMACGSRGTGINGRHLDVFLGRA
ncbi:hypothetical protein D3C79_803520 [compost metagenome]